VPQAGQHHVVAFEAPPGHQAVQRRLHPVAAHVGQVEGVEQLAPHRPLAGEDRQAGEEDGVGHRAPVEQAAGHGGATGPHGRHQVVDVARA
jgi:hypothetical protein